MVSAFGWAIAVFATVWILLAASGIAADVRRGGLNRLLVVVLGIFTLVGGGGFFASALSATGLLKLPVSWEWPAGYVSGVVQMPDGRYIVPLVPSGRVQIYDSHWRFIRGWNVEALGGEFAAGCSPSGGIVVLSARGERQFSFSDSGELVSTSKLTEPYHHLRFRDRHFVKVPTSPLLWVFSSPFVSCALILVGVVGIALVKKLGPYQTVLTRLTADC
ncbi:MAG: hypothetical protein ABSD20_00175 [Terriglobales bacterium]|jgi:hypothetical protein